MRLVGAGARFAYASDALAWHGPSADSGPGSPQIRAQARLDVSWRGATRGCAGAAVAAMSRPRGAPLSPRSLAFFRRPWLAGSCSRSDRRATRSARAR